MNEELKLIGALGGAGLLVGVAKMLVSDEKPKPRQVLGRAILSAATGLAAGGAVVFIPDINFVAQVAIACVLSSLGTSAVETLLTRILKK